MKKFLASILILMFFVISCGNSKKAENDDDAVLPDEDEINDDTQTNPCEDIENSDGSVVDPIYIGQVGIECGCIEGYFWAYENCVSPCDPNPCENDKNSTGECAPLSVDSHSCGCNGGYLWDGKKCSSPCDPNPCENDKNSTGKCAPLSVDSHICGCNGGYFWDGKKCSSPCEPNPCENDEHSTGECAPLSVDSHNCSCNEGYFWDGENCIQNPCNDDPCKNHEHSDNKCVPRDKIRYTCGCEEGFWWWGQNKGCIERKPDIAHICTGQTKCYDDEKEIECPEKGEKYYGQDAQYADLGYCAPPDYTVERKVENEPVVIDNYTGLSWQQNVYSPGTYVPWSNYKNYCNNSTYGGYDDWRLPGVWEYKTIMDFGRYHPNIDPKYFPGTPPDYFITSVSTSYSCGELPHITPATKVAWIKFDHIETGYYSGLCETDPYFNGHARCVRGKAEGASTWSKTISDLEKIRVDSKYGIMLTAKGTPSGKWADAFEVCENLTYAGFSDWRVPNVRDVHIYGGEFSSTTEVYDPTKAVSQIYKERRTENIQCIRENPCEKNKFWFNEKCIDNPCLSNPCNSTYGSKKTCKITDEETYSCTCEKGIWSDELKDCVIEETPDKDAYTDTDEFPDSDTDGL